MSLVQVEAVVRRVMWLTKDPQTKVLVFSTWAEVLQLLEHALKTNQMPCMRAQSRHALEEAIQAFRKPAKPAKSGKPHLQTLLLLLKQGGNGLNLTGMPVTERAACLLLLQNRRAGMASTLSRDVIPDRKCSQRCGCALSGCVHN